MCTDEVIGRLLHFSFIQREGDVACGQALQRIRKRPVENVVFVVFGAVLISRVPVQRNFLGLCDYDVFWQPLIDGVGKPFRWNCTCCIKNCHISKGMDAGVGSACSDDVNIFSGQFAEFFIQYFFNCDSVWLYLPAAVVGAVICDGQFDSFHVLLSFVCLLSSF